MLVTGTVALTAIGLVMVLSASSVAAYTSYGSSFLFFRRQFVYALIGAGALILTSRMRYAAWQRLSLPLIAVSVALLGLVLHPSAGTVAGGSARWLSVGPVTVQPSELAKLALVAFTATILVKKARHLDELAHLALPLLPVVAIVMGLVVLQPDLGTTVLLGGTVFGMLFAAGVRFRYLIGTATIGAALSVLAVMAEGYRRVRFLSFLNPWGDPENSGYQLIQSLIALGSGGWTGVGLGASRQKWLYVPNAHTDFIFAILGEELGLLGAFGVLALFAMMIYAGVRVAIRAPDLFGRLLAAGIVTWFALQAVVNLGAVTGLLPITGVPLPFVSFGGSALVVSMAAVGVLVSIARAPVAGGRPARSTPSTAARSTAGRARRDTG